MKNSDLSIRIVACLQNGAALSYNELVQKLQLVKKEKSLLAETLQALAGEGIIAKRNRKFRLVDQPPMEQPPAIPAGKAHPKLLEGVFDATPMAKNLSYAFVRTDKGDFFINAEDTLNAYHNDVVALEPYYRGGKADRAYVRRIVKRSNASMAGDYRVSGNHAYFISSNLKIHNWFEVGDAGGAKDGDKVVLEVTNWGNPLLGKMPVGRIIEILGPSGDPQVELLAVIRQYQLPLEFPEEVQSEAQGLGREISPSDLKGRRDLRQLFTFTIDPATAKDFDDAISLEKIKTGWRLYVHIADVVHYVKPGGAMFEEASKRGNSFYFPKKVIPMLPELLSNRICSLRPQEDKLTLTVITDFDAHGRIKQQELVESVICSDFRLSYEQVDELFEGRQTDFSPQLQQVLDEARKLSTLLTRKRMQQGYIFFDLPELEYEYDDEGLIRRFTLAEETESHKLIENFMLVANEFVAGRLTQLSPTTIYRIHEDPEPDKIDRLVNLLSHYGISYYDRGSLNASVQYLLSVLPGADYHKVFDRIILRSLKKARYSTEHKRHFGLAMETYTHFTSPIRRLCDLVIHHLCKTFIIHSSQVKLSANHIQHLATVASEQEIQADQAERDIERVYSMAYMKTHIGEKFHGLVISTKAQGLIIHLEEIPVNAILRIEQFPGRGWIYKDREMRYLNPKNNDYFQLLDKVMVQIIDVSDDIYLELQQTPNAHQHQFQIDINASDKKRLASSGGKVKRNAVDYKRASQKSGPQKKRSRGKR